MLTTTKLPNWAPTISGGHLHITGTQVLVILGGLAGLLLLARLRRGRRAAAVAARHGHGGFVLAACLAIAAAAMAGASDPKIIHQVTTYVKTIPTRAPARPAAHAAAHATSNPWPLSGPLLALVAIVFIGAAVALAINLIRPLITGGRS